MLPSLAEKINSPSALLSQRLLKKGTKINREKEGSRDESNKAGRIIKKGEQGMEYIKKRVSQIECAHERGVKKGTWVGMEKLFTPRGNWRTLRNNYTDGTSSTSIRKH